MPANQESKRVRIATKPEEREQFPVRPGLEGGRKPAKIIGYDSRRGIWHEGPAKKPNRSLPRLCRFQPTVCHQFARFALSSLQPMRYVAKPTPEGRLATGGFPRILLAIREKCW